MKPHHIAHETTPLSSLITIHLPLQVKKQPEVHKYDHINAKFGKKVQVRNQIFSLEGSRRQEARRRRRRKGGECGEGIPLSNQLGVWESVGSFPSGRKRF